MNTPLLRSVGCIAALVGDFNGGVRIARRPLLQFAPAGDQQQHDGCLLVGSVAHVDQLIRLKKRAGTAVECLESVLGAYAVSQYERPQDGVAASLHSGPHVDEARQRLEAVVSDLISDAAADGAA